MEANLTWDHGALSGVPRVYLRSLSDERLATMAAEGSDPACTVLFERFQQPLYRYCRSLAGNDADAQDALQTTFTQALVALREDRRNAPVRPWLYRIAHNEAVSLLRRRRPTLELPADELGPSGPSSDEILEQRTRLATLVSDLRALPERQRGALVMRELGGLSHDEIAKTFGISVGAAKQTVLEARRSLQHCAGGRAMDCEEVQRLVSEGDGRTLRGRRVRAHLRDCELCDSFAVSIKTRRSDLRALSPALPAVAASGLLARIAGTSSGHGGGGAGMAAGSTGKAAGMALTAKAVATGAAVVVAAGVGTGAVHHFATTTGPVRPGSASTSARPTPQGTALSARHARAGDAATQLAARHSPADAFALGPRRGHRRPVRAHSTLAARTTAPAITGPSHRREHAGGALGAAPPTGPRHVPSSGTATDRPPAAASHPGNAQPHRSPAANSHRPSAPGSRRAPTARSHRPSTPGSHRARAAGLHRPPTAASHRAPATRAHPLPAARSEQRPAAAAHQTHVPAADRSGTNQGRAPRDAGNTTATKSAPTPAPAASNASAPVGPHSPPATAGPRSPHAG